jgi:hypothetical protein
LSDQSSIEHKVVFAVGLVAITYFLGRRVHPQRAQPYGLATHTGTFWGDLANVFTGILNPRSYLPSFGF